MPTGTYLTEQQISQLCELYKSGLSIRAVAKKLDIDRSTVQRHVADAGLSRPTGRPRRSPEERFFEKVEKTDTCWLWLGAEHNNYGLFRPSHDPSDGKMRPHRWIYERERGPIPEGYEVDHLCRNNMCVNPDHLESVSHQENIDRRQLSAEQHFALVPE